MAKMCVVLQDAKTLLVIDHLKCDLAFFQKLKKEEYIPAFGKYESDAFKVKDIFLNDDNDSALIWVKCNKKSTSYPIITAFQQENFPSYSSLQKLEKQIQQILEENQKETHVHSIAKKGLKKIAKKFGEEAIELVIESEKGNNINFKNEAADVLYYYLILLHERGFGLDDIVVQLKKQNRKNHINSSSRK